ncbi:MAG TPA: hypothetical protein VH186_10215 [Chloroflexia bacterium]|nr:hypothetical protein [Chloroflexia bacterium]
MPGSQFKTAFILSAVIAGLAAVTSAGGLLLPDLYRDNTWTTSQMRGNDLVTLVVAAPLLAVSIIMTRRGSLRWQLVWLSMLGYMFYNYVFYLYGTAFNRFFLLYVVLLTLAIFTLILALSSIEAEPIRQAFAPGTPVKAISGYMLFIAVVLGGMWLAQCLAFLFSGQVPQVILTAGATTSVVFATDLSLMVPAMALGAVLLWRRQAWGYLLGTILMIKGTTYTLALLAMGLFAALAGTLGGDWVLLPLWGLLCAGCLLATGFLLLNVQKERHFEKPSIKRSEPSRKNKTLLMK